MIFLLTGQDILLYFALKHLGDWDKIYTSIKNKDRFDDEEFISLKTKLKSFYVTIIDDSYPEYLRHSFKPPFVIFYYGDLDLLMLNNRITVVGSRDCSSYGEQATQIIVSELAKENYVIVSGLARGIDTIAHKAAIDAMGKTIAVLGSGIDYCYPKQNKALYDKIKNEHLLISEYPFDECASKDNFPKRNRLLAAIGNAVLVSEFKMPSGTSITISCALNLGKDIYCVPFPINKENSNNKLIKEGAILVTSAFDIMEDKK